MKRPLSITIIAWFVLLFSLIHIIISVNYFIHAPNAPSSHPSAVIHALLVDCSANILFFIAAIGFFKAREYSRWLFVVVQIFYWGYFIVIGGMQSLLLIPLLLSFSIIVILFLPRSGAYFKQGLSKQNNND